MATALLVIDVQQALVDALESHRRAPFLRTLSELIARARAAGTPVLYVRHADDELRPNTREWEIAAEIAPQPGDAIIEKRHRDSFRETDLHDVLSRLGTDHVVVCGMQTEFCVDATMREADRRGYRVTLIADGHATYPVDGATEEQIRAQVHRVARGRVAEIVSADDLFAVHP
ncbi:MAG TPA: cysteine hydrolase family protein [Vicinamibacterales bacterium]